MKLLTIALIFFAYFSSSAAMAKELKFSMLRGSESQNIALCVVQEAYKSIGITTIFRKLPTSRSMIESNSGKYDGELSRIKSISKKHKNLIIIPIPTIYMKGIAFTTSVKNFTPNGFSSLAPYEVIINLGSQFALTGTEDLPKVEKVASYKSVFKMLDLGRGNIAVAPYSNGLGLIRQYDLWDIKALQPPLIEIPMFTFLHKKNKHLVPFIQEALKKMKASGRIEKIYNSYLETLIDKNIIPNYDNMNGPSVPCPK